MRHTPNIYSNATPASGPTEVNLLGEAARPRHDEVLGATIDGSTNASRLSQSATTGELVLIKRLMRARAKRSEHFDGRLFADPAWDILLSLARAEVEHRHTTISDLCDGAHVPATTALRWINSMTIAGKLERRPDAFDRRRVYIALSHDSSRAMKDYLAEVQI